MHSKSILLRYFIYDTIFLDFKRKRNLKRNFLFYSRGEFVMHYALKHPKQLPPYFKCDTCDFRGRSHKKVAEHCKTEHNTDYYGYPCSECDYKTKGTYPTQKIYIYLAM